jgi:hypothetical protein
MIGQDLRAGPAQSATMFLQAGQNDLVAVIHLVAAKPRDVACTSIMPLLGRSLRCRQNKSNDKKKPGHLVTPSCTSMKAIKF